MHAHAKELQSNKFDVVCTCDVYVTFVVNWNSIHESVFVVKPCV
jgi:hypothetical protein